MNARSFGWLLCSFLLPTFLLGQAKYSNEFLAIGIGAKAQGMATAMVAHTDDVHAGYWNPAGLAQLEAPLQVAAMHAEWFAGISKYDYLGLVKTLDTRSRSAVGVSIIRLGIDQIPNTLNLVEPDGSINFDNLSEFSAADYGVLLSYSREIRTKNASFLFVGGNAKVIRRVIGSFGNSWGFGIDLGVQYQHRNWRLGLMARDVSFTFNAWSFTLTEEEKKVFRNTGNVIPTSSIENTFPKFILGGSRQFQLGEKWNFLVALDLHFNTDGQRNVLINSKVINIDPYLGLQLDYDERVFLRTGLGNFQRALDDIDGTTEIFTFQPHMGIGLALGRLSIDYAYTDIGNVSQALFSHVFSLSLKFKRKGE